MTRKSIFLLPFFALIAILGVAVSFGYAHAQSFTIPNPIGAGTIPDALLAVTSFLLWIAIPILTVMVIWAGFIFLTSGGDPQKIIQARTALIWAGIGFAAVLINQGIALIIREILGGGNP